jgi:hypothetical protein
MSDSKRDDKFSEAEAQRRYEQALKGAFKTPPQAMKDVPSKRPKPTKKP